jgi:aspartyl-tRNA(Asn)/glutamyl-tRNA(Gln) amidotransferase subunit A
MDDDVLYSTIPELGEWLAKGEFTSRELTEAYLGRLTALGARFNSLARLTEETAFRQAEAADRLFAHRRIEGPLQGIPFGVKDLLSAKGYITSWGAEVFRDQQFGHDATALKKLAHAGGVLVAKLAMVRFAGGGGYDHPTESLHGPGRNPWNPKYWAGGSSSGSGGAVAAAMTPFAIGSETWGSIVGPCSYCAVTGLRPTYGLVSRYGAMALSWTMDKLGPMCRSAEDCALVLEAISGPDADDPSQSGRRFRADAPEPPVSMLRIGFSEVDFGEWAHPDSRPALSEALRVLRETGAAFKSVALPEMPYRDVARTLISCEAASVFEDVIRSEEFEHHPDLKQKEGFRRGLQIPATDYLKAMRLRRLMQEKISEFFEEVDIVVQPASANTAPLIEKDPDSEVTTSPELSSKGNTDLGAAGNATGLPALTIPCGFGQNGLPTALQLVARPNNEAALLAVGKEFQRRTNWHRRRPPV